MNPSQDTRIAIIGLGYVGLPLAVNFANAFDRKYPATAFDIKQPCIDELNSGRDSIREDLKSAKRDELVKHNWYKTMDHHE